MMFLRLILFLNFFSSQKQKTSRLGGFSINLLEITVTMLMDSLNMFLKSVRIEHL